MLTRWEENRARTSEIRSETSQSKQKSESGEAIHLQSESGDTIRSEIESGEAIHLETESGDMIRSK